MVNIKSRSGRLFNFFNMYICMIIPESFAFEKGDMHLANIVNLDFENHQNAVTRQFTAEDSESYDKGVDLDLLMEMNPDLFTFTQKDDKKK